MISTLLLIILLTFSSTQAVESRCLFESEPHGAIHPLIKLSSQVPIFKEAPVFKNGIECIPPEKHQTQQDIGSSGFALCDPFSIHIAMTLDVPYVRGSIAAILSIVQHASCPENIVFHFLASSHQSVLADTVRTTFPYLRFHIYDFDEDLVKQRISASIRQALEQPLNYARIYIADVLPSCINRVIYLDSDVVVVDDIVRLWGTGLNGHPIGAPEYCHANFSKYFTEAFWDNEQYASTFARRRPCYFNTGVMVMDLAKWREEKFTQKVEQWMEVQKAKRIYELGSLPPFLLVFAGDVEAVEHRWNQHGLGGDNLEGRCRGLHKGPVSLLHWSGKGKPWDRLDVGKPCPLDSLWASYDLGMLSSSMRLNAAS
ncbi:hypothetical protein L7F22_022569 [Adiantum nelumboides]|nr:hypothetical protein [Adiantum nelumboides]